MGKIFKSFREESKKDYGQNLEEEEKVCSEQLGIGALLRIADAMEIMSKNHKALMEERDKFERWYRDGEKVIQALERKIVGLKGYITKLKNR